MPVPGNDRVFEYIMTENKHHLQIDALPDNYTDAPSPSFATVQHVVPVIDGNIDGSTDVLYR